MTLESPEAAGGLWRCGCGEQLEAHFSHCWQCRAARDGGEVPDSDGPPLLPHDGATAQLRSSSLAYPGAVQGSADAAPVFSDADGLLRGVRVGSLLPHGRIVRASALAAGTMALLVWTGMFLLGKAVFGVPVLPALHSLAIAGFLFFVLEMTHLSCWGFLWSASRRMLAEFQVIVGRSPWLWLAYLDIESEQGELTLDGGVLGLASPGVLAFCPLDGEPQRWPLTSLQHVRVLPARNLAQWAWRGTGPVRLSWDDGTWRDFLVHDGPALVRFIETATLEDPALE